MKHYVHVTHEHGGGHGGGYGGGHGGQQIVKVSLKNVIYNSKMQKNICNSIEKFKIKFQFLITIPIVIKYNQLSSHRTQNRIGHQQLHLRAEIR